MSDYLWDKTGEPDEEVERLEELLGSFGHKPRALELPSGAAPAATSLALRPRPFRPALLAAAALLLMALAGAALFVLRQGGADGNQQSARSNPQAAPFKENPPAPVSGPKPPVESPKRGARAGDGDALVKGSKAPDFQASAGGRRRSSTGSRSGRQARQVAAAQEPHVAARRESPAPTSVERQAAKEQLVYALRLASAKLNEVRKMTRGEESPRHGFNERNRIL